MRKSAATVPADPYVHYGGCSISRFPDFEEAEESVFSAIHRLTLPKMDDRPWKDRVSFLAKCVEGRPPARELAKVFQIYMDMAVRAEDPEFFVELMRDHSTKTSKARAGRKVAPLKVPAVTMYLLAYWTERLLWLSTDYAGSLFFQRGLGLPISEAAYTKARFRLKLHQHPKLQPISGYSPKTGFIFRSGDLDSFVTTLSE